MTAPSLKTVTIEDRALIDSLMKNKKEKVLFYTWIRKQKTEKKIEDRILIITKYRVLTIGKRKGGIKKKICRNGHLFELKELTSFNDQHVLMVFEKFRIDAYSTESDEMVETILTNYLTISQGFPPDLFVKFVCEPEGRLGPFDLKKKPGFGIAQMYKAWCNFHETIPNKEFISFMIKDTISNEEMETTALDFTKFPGTVTLLSNSKDIDPIIDTLKYNKYFRTLIIKGIKKDLITSISRSIRENTTLSRITLSGFNSSSGIDLLGQALESNKNLPLKYLDISFNKITSSTVNNGLGIGLKEMKSGLETLNVSYCDMPSKPTARFFQFLSGNKNHTIFSLNVSGNAFRKKGSLAFAEWIKSIKETDFLESLDISKCQINFPFVFNALNEHYRTKKLRILDLSENKIQKNSIKSIREFIKNTTSLSEINLTETNLLQEEVAQVLEDILSNSKLKNFVLIIGGNTIGPKGASLITEIFKKYPDSQTLSELVIDDCGFGAEGITNLFGDTSSGIFLNKSLRKLSLSRNVEKVKLTKLNVSHLANILSHSSLEYLRIRGNNKYSLGSGMKEALASMKTLDVLVLDIIGNDIGGLGVNELARILSEKSTKTLSIHFDYNKNTLSSIQSLAYCFKSNTTLMSVQWPKFDVNKMVVSANKKEKKNLRKNLKSLKEEIMKASSDNNTGIEIPTMSSDHYELRFAKIRQIGLGEDETQYWSEYENFKSITSDFETETEESESNIAHNLEDNIKSPPLAKQQNKILENIIPPPLNDKDIQNLENIIPPPLNDKDIQNLENIIPPPLNDKDIQNLENIIPPPLNDKDIQNLENIIPPPLNDKDLQNLENIIPPPLNDKEN
ncbi:leucine-rich repeat isoform f [Anaeramoeba ignava]|uniref:Leucine-rich repeat isoform f n=1 Tax=Anaeramoeba ignava TaxID=1746090 RepID=A0A9Q0LTR3_ANAIG|nr:leucine-rich repeat isoform f [Anaeramoeba ignava]